MALLLSSYYAKEMERQNRKAERAGEYSEFISKIIRQKNMMLSSLALRTVLKNGCEDYYANALSVMSYPVYLFRTDRNQKWTNWRSLSNICILPFSHSSLPVEMEKDGFYCYKIANPEMKAELHQKFMEWQKDKMGVNSYEPKNLSIMRRKIRFFDMEIDGGYQQEKTLKEAVAVMRDISLSEANVYPLLAVIHIDEDADHVHFLYGLDSSNSINKKALKQIPHIEKIIKSKYE